MYAPGGVCPPRFGAIRAQYICVGPAEFMDGRSISIANARVLPPSRVGAPCHLVDALADTHAAGPRCLHRRTAALRVGTREDDAAPVPALDTTMSTLRPGGSPPASENETAGSMYRNARTPGAARRSEKRKFRSFRPISWASPRPKSRKHA